VIRHALKQREEVLRVISERGGARQHADIRPVRQLRHDTGKPGPCRLAIDLFLRLGQKAAAEFFLLVADDDTRTTLGGRKSGRESGRAGANHQDVASGVPVRVLVGIGLSRRTAEPGRGPDEGLVQLSPRPARPHEGLVVEACRDESGQRSVQRTHVQRERRPAVLTGRAQTIEQRDLCCACVRIAAASASMNCE
jgi:hypothetical protein